MRAQWITGLFQYEPCELTADDGRLRFSAAGTTRSVAVEELQSAALTRMRNGTCRLEFSTRSEQFEFLLSDAAADEEATGLLYALTRNNARLELRMRGA